jgi:zinc transporter 1/2/3
MIPDAIDNFSRVFPDLNFPVVLFTAGIGFFLVLLLEKIVAGNHEGIGRLLGSRPLYPFLLALVLSTHSIITGTVLGLEKSFMESFAIFVAIIGHKSAAAFALGVSLQRAELTTKRFIYLILFFSLMTPAGILAGTFFSASFSGGIDASFEAVFDSLAGGTFLYVAIIGIMEEVFENRKDLWIKFSFILFGFALMAVLSIWT